MKIAVNRGYGGFSLSERAADRLGIAYWQPTLGMVHVDNGAFGITSENTYAHRTDPRLLALIEEMGAEINGACAHIAIIEIPDDVQWEIEEYDGNEWVSEVHRTW
jgi:hypothetical protein